MLQSNVQPKRVVHPKRQPWKCPKCRAQAAYYWSNCPKCGADRPQKD